MCSRSQAIVTDIAYDATMPIKPEDLKSLHCFAPLTHSELQQLCDSTVIQDYRKGDYLIREGGLNHFLFFIARGSVHIKSYGVTIAELSSGDLIGEVSIAGLGAPIADVTARGPVLTYKFPIETIHKISSSNRLFASHLHSQAMGRVLR